MASPGPSVIETSTTWGITITTPLLYQRAQESNNNSSLLSTSQLAEPIRNGDYRWGKCEFLESEVEQQQQQNEMQQGDTKQTTQCSEQWAR